MGVSLTEIRDYHAKSQRADRINKISRIFSCFYPVHPVNPVHLSALCRELNSPGVCCRILFGIFPAQAGWKKCPVVKNEGGFLLAAATTGLPLIRCKSEVSDLHPLRTGSPAEKWPAGYPYRVPCDAGSSTFVSARVGQCAAV